MCAIQKILLLYIASGIVFLENGYIFTQLTYLIILRIKILRYNYHKINSLEDILYYMPRNAKIFYIICQNMPRCFISYAEKCKK